MKGIVKVPLVKGRYELGWEAAMASVLGTTQQNITMAIVLNNDSDFVIRDFWIQQFRGVNQMFLDPSITIQLRDGATGLNLLRQPASATQFCKTPPQNAMNEYSFRNISNHLGLPAPYVLRRASSLFVEIVNPNSLTWDGDLYFIAEGFRIYPGQSNPVPETIEGFALPFSWSSQFNVTALAGAGLQKIGTITASGLGQGRFVLKQAAVAWRIASSGGGALTGIDELAINIRDSQAQSKLWVRMTNPPTVGDHMPVNILTKGKTSFPWVYPRYIDGKDTIFVDLFTDPSKINVGALPATIDFQLQGVWVP